MAIETAFYFCNQSSGNLPPIDLKRMKLAQHSLGALFSLVSVLLITVRARNVPDYNKITTDSKLFLLFFEMYFSFAAKDLMFVSMYVLFAVTRKFILKVVFFFFFFVLSFGIVYTKTYDGY